MTETPATPAEAVTFDDICRAALEEATRNKGSALGSDVGEDERAAYEAGYDAALARIRTAMGASAG